MCAISSKALVYCKCLNGFSPPRGATFRPLECFNLSTGSDPPPPLGTPLPPSLPQLPPSCPRLPPSLRRLKSPPPTFFLVYFTSLPPSFAMQCIDNKEQRNSPMSLSRTRHVYSSRSWPLAGCRNLLWCALSPLLVNTHRHWAHAPWPFNILWPRRRSNSEQCAAFNLVQLYIECTISATMPNYAGSSRKLYQNENYVCSNHNDIKNAFIPFRNKEINVCLATNSSPACCATPNLSTGRDPPPPLC